MKYPFLIVFILMVLLSSSCKKQESINPHPSTTISTDVDNKGDVIITPFGPMNKSHVHFIDSNYHLSVQGDHLVQVDNRTKKTVVDFGVQTRWKNSPITTINGSATAVNSTSPNGKFVSPALQSGWITYAQNDVPITQIGSFHTDWIVPNNPPTYHGQLLYLFNALQDGFDNNSHILQPVLQFGPNGWFGGNYWVINNWYASCQGCDAYYGTPVTVTPGTHIIGNIIGHAGTGGTYSYTSEFQPYVDSGRIILYPASNRVSVSNVPEMKYVFVTMEAYNMQQSLDYPDGVCRMRNNVVAHESVRPRDPGQIVPLNLIPYNVITDVGQHTTIVAGGSYGPEVDLFFH